MSKEGTQARPNETSKCQQLRERNEAAREILDDEDVDEKVVKTPKTVTSFELDGEMYSATSCSSIIRR